MNARRAEALPTFIVGGSAKCGTTTLHVYLDAHPDIAMSRPKQTHYFDNEDLYAKGPGYYASCFAHARNERAIGETTPSYIHGRYIAQRIIKDLPDIKVVFVFRDPVHRAYSNYWHAFRRGRRVGTFAQAFDDPACRNFWERSRYAAGLRDYLELFPEGRVHCLLYERLRAETDDTLSELFRFLGVDDSVRIRVDPRDERKSVHGHPRSIALQRLAHKYLDSAPRPEDVSAYDKSGKFEFRSNARRFRRLRRVLSRAFDRVNLRPQDYPPISEADAARARELFTEDNRELAELTGLDLQRWWPNA